MRKTTVLGLICGITCIVVAISIQGTLYYFVNLSASLIVFGGTLSAVLVAFSPNELIGAIKSLREVFSVRIESVESTINLLTDVARRTRREGFFSISIDPSTPEYAFLLRSIELVREGATPEEIQETLSIESENLGARNRTSERVFRVMATYSPMFGLLGTLIGLITMLRSVSEPAAIPPAMAIALVTTFYGVILSTLLFNPLSNKIRVHNNATFQIRELIIEAILLMQRGENPFVVRERLEAYVAS